jgi:hypothetical protein
MRARFRTAGAKTQRMCLDVWIKWNRGRRHSMVLVSIFLVGEGSQVTAFLSLVAWFPVAKMWCIYIYELTSSIGFPLLRSQTSEGIFETLLIWWLQAGKCLMEDEKIRKNFFLFPILPYGTENSNLSFSSM